MSRVGSKPIPIPENTQVFYENRTFRAEGEKGKLERTIHPWVDLRIEEGNIRVVPIRESRKAKEDKKARAFQGLVRSLVANMVQGVSQGFERVLEIHGIGYRAEAQGQQLNLVLGYSHPVQLDLPEGVTATVDKNNVIRLAGIDRELLGHWAAKIRGMRPPEPYKGKGVKYAEERIQRKAGKSGKK